jgi:hypothetical protein
MQVITLRERCDRRGWIILLALLVIVPRGTLVQRLPVVRQNSDLARFQQFPQINLTSRLIQSGHVCWVCFGDSSTLDVIFCWRIWPFANSFWPRGDEIRGLGSLDLITCSGLSPDGYGHNGSRLWLSSLPRPLWGGIEPDSACTGIGSRAIEKRLVGSQSARSCES